MAIKSLNGSEIPIKVVGSSSFGRYGKISCEKTYNLFESDGWLVPFAGYKRVLELLPAGAGRGIFHSIRGNFLIAVVNANVYKIDFVLPPVKIGTINTNFGEVVIDENLNNQICIVDGVNIWIYNWGTNSALTVQTGNPLDNGTLVPNYVCFHNTFFLIGNANRSGSSQSWYAYSFVSATTIGIASTQGGTFALETKPDYPIAVKRIPGQAANVLVFGTSVCEIYTQIGGVQNYRRNNTASIDYGCASVSTIASSDQYIAWLAVNESNAPVIMAYSGQDISPISSDGIDYLMESIKYPNQSTAMFCRVDGHLFYQLTFYNPADNITLAYDFTAEKFYNLSDSELNYHPARDYVYFNQKTYFISLKNASIYVSSTDINTYDENILNPWQPGYDLAKSRDIQRIRICDTVRQPDNDRFIANVLTFTIEQGEDPNVSGLSVDIVFPLLSEDGATISSYPILTEPGISIVDESSWNSKPSYTMPYQPRVDLSISYDDGATWSATVSKELNPVGYRKNILNFNRLGAANSLIFKIRFWGTGRVIAGQGMLEVY